MDERPTWDFGSMSHQNRPHLLWSSDFALNLEQYLMNECHTWHIDSIPVSIQRKSLSGRHRPVRVADGPMTARCRFT